MAKNLEINIDVKLNKDKVNSLQDLIKSIEKGVTLKLDTSKAETSLSSFLNKLKEIQNIANNININVNNTNFNNKNIEQLNKEKEILEQVATAKKKANEVVLNNSSIKQTDVQSYDKLQQKLNEIINSKKQLNSVTMNTDNLQNLTSAVIKYKNELGQAIAEQWKLITDKKTNISSFVNTSTKVSDNTSQKTIEDTNKMYQKMEQDRRSEAEKTAQELNRIEREKQRFVEEIENKRLQSLQRKKQEEINLEQTQAQASNRVLEQNYKEQQQLIEQMENQRLKSIERKKKEEASLQQTQAKANNKALEQNYREQQQFIEQIENKRLQSIKKSKQEEASLLQNQAQSSNKALEQKYKEEQNFIEQVENKRLQSIEKAKQEEIKLQQTQAKFSNKALDQNYREQQKAIEDTNKMYQKLEQNRRSEAEKTASELNRVERERQQLIEQIENKRLQSTQRVKQEELSLQQIQAKFSNKALEQDYKEREKTIEQIENKRIQAIQKAREEEIKLQRTQAQASNKALEQGYKEKQTTLYNEINNLLKEQYRIETQLITADGERKQTLQQNLQTIKQSLAIKSNNKEELLTQQQLNNLLNTEIQLKRNLETVQATKNDKVNQELINIRELIQLSQKQLNNQLNEVQNKNGNLVNTSFLGQLKESLKGNEITNRIDQIRAKINALNGTNTKEVRTQVANLKAEIVELDQKARMNGLQVGQRQFSSFGQAISSTLSKFGIFLTTATACRKMIQEIKEGIEYVKYLDESFTDMAMTMEISRSQFNDMSEDIDKLASKLGVTSQYVHDIARVYSNASTTIEEVMKKVKGASELANISGMDGLETTKAIQSITNQFKLMQKEGADAGKVTSHIGDVLTKISQNIAYDFASGIKEMNNAISTSGSVAEMSGDGLERYTATIGALIEQTGRTGEELANAYKMISARVE